MSKQENRPRGMLTPKDRELLRGEIEYKHQQQYSNRRRDIRERVANGLLDFNIIQYLLQDKDRKLIFRDPSSAAGVDDALFSQSIQSMLYWTYLGLKEQNYNFNRLLIEAVEEATEDFARKYWGESVEATVRFDIDVTRKYEIDELITAIENGGPVKSNQVYDLLKLSEGVPIDTSELDTLKVTFQSSYPEGEKAVLNTIFSEYLNTDVEITDIENRVDLTFEDFKNPEDLDPTDIKKQSAVNNKNKSRPDPSKISNYRKSLDFGSDSDIRKSVFNEQEDSTGIKQSNLPENDKSISGSIFDDMMDWDSATESPPSIYDLIDEREEQDTPEKPVTPEMVFDLLEEISNSFVSTIEIGAALGCAPDAARQALSELLKNRQVKRERVIDSNHKLLHLWSIRPGPDQNELATE